MTMVLNPIKTLIALKTHHKGSFNNSSNQKPGQFFLSTSFGGDFSIVYGNFQWFYEQGL
jgi:hypothetical protein